MYRVIAPGLTLEICFHSLSLAFFYQFSSNWVKELILKSSVFVLQMDKFRQISTELWLLKMVARFCNVCATKTIAKTYHI